MIQQRLSVIEHQMETAPPLPRVHLAQERIELQAELSALAGAPDLETLEDEFVTVAATYSERQGLTYAAWREAGVPPAVLRRAGIIR